MNIRREREREYEKKVKEATVIVPDWSLESHSQPEPVSVVCAYNTSQNPKHGEGRQDPEQTATSL